MQSLLPIFNRNGRDGQGEVARALLDKLAFVYTPKHGSWLNMAECEFSVLSRQCFDQRLPDMETVRNEVNAWAVARNQAARLLTGGLRPRMRG